jgi:hypothetical protein
LSAIKKKIRNPSAQGSQVYSASDLLQVRNINPFSKMTVIGSSSFSNIWLVKVPVATGVFGLVDVPAHWGVTPVEDLKCDSCRTTL